MGKKTTDNSDGVLRRETYEESWKRERRERIRYVLATLLQFIVFGVAATSLWWGWILLGWLMERLAL